MSESEIVCYNRDVEANKVIAILAYIWILLLIPLLAAKGSRFARFHAYQGVSLFISWIVVNVLVWLIFYDLAGLLSPGLLLLAVIGVMKACNALPFIGGFMTPKD